MTCSHITTATHVHRLDCYRWEIMEENLEARQNLMEFYPSLENVYFKPVLNLFTR